MKFASIDDFPSVGCVRGCFDHSDNIVDLSIGFVPILRYVLGSCGSSDEVWDPSIGVLPIVRCVRRPLMFWSFG